MMREEEKEEEELIFVECQVSCMHSLSSTGLNHRCPRIVCAPVLDACIHTHSSNMCNELRLNTGLKVKFPACPICNIWDILAYPPPVW